MHFRLSLDTARHNLGLDQPVAWQSVIQSFADSFFYISDLDAELLSTVMAHPYFKAT